MKLTQEQDFNRENHMAQIHYNCRFWKSASLIGANNDAFSSRLTLEQDFNRENHMAQIFSHLVMPGEISKESHIFQLFVRKLQRQKLIKFYLRELSFDFWAVAQYAWVAQSYN